jgi:hypothetical protein
VQIFRQVKSREEIYVTEVGVISYVQKYQNKIKDLFLTNVLNEF